jgi:hypothetical protein
MAELKVYLSEELDKRFRKLAMDVYGYGRGSMSEAAVDALTQWCDGHESGKLDQLPEEAPSYSNSDPVSRAEERPSVASSENRENSRSVLPLS